LRHYGRVTPVPDTEPVHMNVAADGRPVPDDVATPVTRREKAATVSGVVVRLAGIVIIISAEARLPLDLHVALVLCDFTVLAAWHVLQFAARKVKAISTSL